MPKINTPKIKKILQFLIAFIIISTFLISLFGSVYMEGYNTSEIAKYNSEETSWRDFCLSQNPPGGIVFYQKIFPFGFSMIVISVALVLIVPIFALLKIKLYNKYTYSILIFLALFSYYILMGAWMDTDPQFYECIGSFVK